MDQETLIRYFLNGHTKGKSSSLRIEGNRIYSYSTPIARREGDNIYLNSQKYSVTTTTQQNKIRQEAIGMGKEVVEVSPEEI